MSDDGPTLESIQAWNTSLVGDLDTLWLMLGSVLVFLMQAGFAMLEVGSVNAKNTRNILLKNVLDASIGAVIWWIVGFGVATGTSENGFFGSDRFGLTAEEFMDGTGYTYATWLFQWAFAATTATIVSGAVAERCTLTAYFSYSIALISFIYPVVAQVGWGGGGKMSPWLGSDNKDDYFIECGVIDFAGSGVVHMCGGVAALVGSILLGPRQSFKDGTIETPTYGPVFQTMGTLILWFGWYGFNGGSTLYIVGYGQVAAKVMVCTTLSAACGALSTLLVGTALESSAQGKLVIRLEWACNGVLAGLVGITAGCAVVEPYGAVLIGLLAGPVYLLASKTLKACGIDDVVDAFPVHGACGCWGVVAAALFATKENYSASYGIYEGAADTCAGLFYGGKGNQLTANLLFVLFVAAWTGGWSLVVFGALRAHGVLRVSAEVEEEGMDSSEHGATSKTKLMEVQGQQSDEVVDTAGASKSKKAAAVLEVVDEDESTTTTSPIGGKKIAGKSPQNSIKEAVAERKSSAASMDRPPVTNSRSKSPGLSMKAQLAAKNGN